MQVDQMTAFEDLPADLRDRLKAQAVAAFQPKNRKERRALASMQRKAGAPPLPPVLTPEREAEIASVEAAVSGRAVPEGVAEHDQLRQINDAQFADFSERSAALECVQQELAERVLEAADVNAGPRP